LLLLAGKVALLIVEELVGLLVDMDRLVALLMLLLLERPLAVVALSVVVFILGRLSSRLTLVGVIADAVVGKKLVVLNEIALITVGAVLMLLVLLELVVFMINEESLLLSTLRMVPGGSCWLMLLLFEGVAFILMACETTN